MAELPERFALEIDAFVLMDNRYHLLVRTGEANLGHAVRWLNVGCSLSLREPQIPVLIAVLYAITGWVLPLGQPPRPPKGKNLHFTGSEGV